MFFVIAIVVVVVVIVVQCRCCCQFQFCAVFWLQAFRNHISHTHTHKLMYVGLCNSLLEYIVFCVCVRPENSETTSINNYLGCRLQCFNSSSTHQNSICDDLISLLQMIESDRHTLSHNIHSFIHSFIRLMPKRQ